MVHSFILLDIRVLSLFKFKLCNIFLLESHKVTSLVISRCRAKAYLDYDDVH